MSFYPNPKAGFARFLAGACLGLLALTACSGQPGSLKSGFEPDGGPITRLEQGGYRLDRGPLQVTITPERGGRIQSLSYQGRELLMGPQSDPKVHWGNVLWPAPQSDWGWPPLKTLDEEPYYLLSDRGALTLASGVEPRFGYQFVKTYWLEPGDGALVIDYRIINHSDRVRPVAPWEVTRVPPKGLVFFPAGSSTDNSGPFALLNTHTRKGITWFRYRPENIQENSKFMTDGSGGWLAYVSQGLALIKEFDDVPANKNLPGEGEIQIYADGEKTVMEVEQQGTLTQLASGESLQWRVRWHLRPVPGEIPIELGSEALTRWVQTQVLASP